MASSAPKDASAQTYPIVETTHGKVRGVAADGVSGFKGIPYGASTAGRNRCMPPVAPTPWPGVRDALSYGASAPQNPSSMRGLVDPKSAFAAYGDADSIIESEDCLVLNVWTPAADDSSARPVMVFASWRWLPGELGLAADLRRQQSGAARRRSRGQREPSPGRVGLHIFRRYRR